MRQIAWKIIKLMILSLFIALVLLWASRAWSAETINLDVIQRIESGGNPLAYNKRTHARGLYQITPICLRHYNEANKTELYEVQLFEPSINKAVAVWYFGWIAERLDTVDEILIAYNFGIGNLRKYQKGLIKLPDETRYYLTSYHKYV